MSRPTKRLLHKTKKPVVHLAKKAGSVYALIFMSLFAGAGTYVIMSSLAATTCDRSATTSTFASQVTAATAGQTICLDSGNYGTWAGTNKAITIAADPAAGSAPTMMVNFDSGDRDFTLDGMSGMGGLVTSTQKVTIKNSTFSSAIDFEGNNTGFVLESNTLDWPAVYTGSGNAKIFFNNSHTGTVAAPSVTIKNNLIANGNLDGIHTGGDGLVIIGNTFKNLCDTGTNHTDNIQFEGGAQVRIADNYVYAPKSCNTQGITSFDGGTNGVIVENNVVDIARDWGIEFYADHNSIIRHNTVVYHDWAYSDFGNGTGAIDINTKGAAGSGTQVYDNIATDVGFHNGVTGTASNNLIISSGDNCSSRDNCITQSGNTVTSTEDAFSANMVGGTLVYYSDKSTAAITGYNTSTHKLTVSVSKTISGAGADYYIIPTYAGGASPNTYAGFALATGSPGKGAATYTVDSQPDIGVNVGGGGSSTPGDTTAPTVSLTAPANNATVSGSSVTLSATASDDAAVSKVEFYVDGNLVGTSNSSPYNYSWDSRTAANSSHTLTAKAYDTSNNSTTSSGRTITTNNASLCATTSSNWQNQSLGSQTGTFTVDFDATPSANGIDSLSGISNGAAGDFTDPAAIVRFNPNGQIDARNGGAYAAANTVNYSAGVSYHFTLTVNVSNHTYSVDVTPNGGSKVNVASNYAFRTEQASVSSLSNFTTYSTTGTHTVCGVTIVPGSGGGSSSPVNTAVPAVTGTLRVSSTLTSSQGTWSNNPTSYSYQWQRCDSSGANCADITNATTSTYKLTCSDYKKTVRSQVKAINSSGNATSNSNTSTSIAKPTTPTKGDFNDDCFVDANDVSLFVTKWRASASSNPSFDITGSNATPDGFIDAWDLNLLVSGYGYRG